MKRFTMCIAATLLATACAKKPAANTGSQTGTQAGSGAITPAAGELPVGTWHVTAISDGKGGMQNVVGDRPLTAEFSHGAAGDTVGGNAGCNHFGGPVTISGGKLAWGALAITEMACVDNNMMTQEGAYMRALNASTSFAVVAAGLEFHDAAGTITLTMQKAP
jgi:heat shock protein HslJ